MVTAVASPWSEHTSTSASSPESRFSISAAGRWWNAAATRRLGQCGLHGRGHRTPRRDQGQHLAALLDQGVRHGDHHLPVRGSRRAFTVAMALSHGVATTTTSAPPAPSLSAPPMPGQVGPAGHRLRAPHLPPVGVRANPRVTLHPGLASRTATPRPAGPVPPSIPTCIPPTCRITSGIPWDFSTVNDSSITGVLTDASLAFAVARGPGGGGRDRAFGSRTGPLPHQAHGPEAPRGTRGPRDRRHLRRTAAAAGGRPGAAVGSAGRFPPRHRLCPAELPGQRHVCRRLGRRLGRPQHFRLLAQGPGGGLPSPS